MIDSHGVVAAIALNRELNRQALAAASASTTAQSRKTFERKAFLSAYY